MGVTRIRYLLDQWRLRSVGISLQNRLVKDRPPVGWEFPPVTEPPPEQNGGEEPGAPSSTDPTPAP